MTYKFPWGRVIERFKYNFDGDNVEIVKYHPHKRDEKGFAVYDDEYNRFQAIDTDKIEYHLEGHHVSCGSVEGCLIYWMAEKHLGLNNHSLVAGICRALDVKG